MLITAAEAACQDESGNPFSAAPFLVEYLGGDDFLNFGPADDLALAQDLIQVNYEVSGAIAITHVNLPHIMSDV